MDLPTLINLIMSFDFLTIFFKIVNVSFSIFYLLYAIVIESQTRVMNSALDTDNNQLIEFISIIQIIVAILIVILAIFVF